MQRLPEIYRKLRHVLCVNLEAVRLRQILGGQRTIYRRCRILASHFVLRASAFKTRTPRSSTGVVPNRSKPSRRVSVTADSSFGDLSSASVATKALTGTLYSRRIWSNPEAMASWTSDLGAARHALTTMSSTAGMLAASTGSRTSKGTARASTASGSTSNGASASSARMATRSRSKLRTITEAGGFVMARIHPHPHDESGALQPV
jgi:hypothetical protein